MKTHWDIIIYYCINKTFVGIANVRWSTTARWNPMTFPKTLSTYGPPFEINATSLHFEFSFSIFCTNDAIRNNYTKIIVGRVFNSLEWDNRKVVNCDIYYGVLFFMSASLVGFTDIARRNFPPSVLSKTIQSSKSEMDPPGGDSYKTKFWQESAQVSEKS